MAGEGDRGSNRSSVEGEDGFEGHRGFFERLNQNRDGSDGDDEDFALEGGTRGRGRGRGAHGEGEQDGPGKLKGLERFEKKPSEDVDYRQGRRWARPEKVGEGEEELDEKDYGYGGEGNVRAAGGRYGAGGEGKATGEDGDQDGDGEGEEDDDSFFGGPWGRRLHDHEQTGDHEHTGDDSDSHGEGRWGGERYPGGGGRGGDGDVGSSSRSGASDSDWSGLGELWNTTTTTEGGSSEIGRGKSRGALGVALGFKEGRGDPGEDSGASGKKGKRSPFDSSFSSSSAFDRRKSRVAFLNHPDGADSHTVGDQGGEAMKTEKSSRFNGKGEAGAEEGGAKEKETQWRSQIEERLEQLEKGLTGITRAVQQVANGTKEMNDKMQDWFSMIGGKLSRLQSDVDMQRNLRGGSGGSDFGTTGAEPHGQESVNRRLQDLSRLMTMGERSQQQISQSITELKSQLAGFERRLPPSMIPVDEGKRPANPDLVVDEIIVRGQGRHRSSPSYTETTTVEDGGEDDDDEGDDGRDHDERSSPMDTSSRRCCCCCCCCCPCCKKSSQQPQDSSSCCPCMAMLSQQRQNPAHQKELYGDHNSADRRLLLSDVKARIETVLRNVEKIDEYGEELGDLLRCLASCTAPDGLKGLNPVEKKLFTFAGTPKTFEALHTFESALDRLRVCGTGLADH
ncbi:hypothetical protein CSUI_001714 [Cystoisospora suis]|uniref:Uncharacterized protein n=1 Tax=Cystoisospora suis TaxID=483139 RepID=A0A2C6L7I6_9APIC|nr:hypothetical protein CSUI_001714 [Cystoisospora suis]